MQKVVDIVKNKCKKFAKKIPQMEKHFAVAFLCKSRGCGVGGVRKARVQCNGGSCGDVAKSCEELRAGGSAQKNSCKLLLLLQC